MIRSMTGFGAAEGHVGGSRVSVELRTVNHRFFSPSIKLPGELSRWEPDVREALRRRISRGHVTVSARTERASALSGVIDEARFAQYATMLRDLRDRHGLDGAIDVATVLRLPDVVADARRGRAAAGYLSARAAQDRRGCVVAHCRARAGTRGGTARPP